MYFTDSPHLQSIEAAMKMIPRHPLIQDAEQKESSMKLKFLSEDHRDRFLSLFKRLRTNPLRSEPEYCAAIYLLTADPGLWETVVDAYFYEAAEGLIASVILIIAEFCPPEKRHIISVFKLIQDLLAPSNINGKTKFKLLIDKLPSELRLGGLREPR